MRIGDFKCVDIFLFIVLIILVYIIVLKLSIYKKFLISLNILLYFIFFCNEKKGWFIFCYSFVFV